MILMLENDAKSVWDEIWPFLQKMAKSALSSIFREQLDMEA